MSSPRDMSRHVPFPFPDGRFPRHLGAVVQKTVLEGQEPAREVIHTNDNSWLMGDGVHDPNVPGASIATHIRHVIDADPTLEELASLPLDHIAKRAGPHQPWQITRHAWLDESSEDA